jgi:hypothetical protein
MSDRSCPKGLKPFEVERGHTNVPPIPYIPVADELAEAVTKTSGASGYKLDLPSGIKVTHALWENGNAEAFLKHVMAALSYVHKKGYVKEYEEAERRAGLAVHEQQVREDAYIAAHAVAVGDPQPELEAYEEAEAKVRDRNLALIEVARKMFVLYENLLSENARHKWTTIVESQVEAINWTDLKGSVHADSRPPSYESFEDCVKFHLLSVFPRDAAEQERYYINVHLKKPTRVLIRHFVDRLVQLNSYLGTLPCVYDSPMAIGKTKKITPFDEVDLAQLILKTCPMEWQNQYSLSQGIIPQDMRSLLDTLELIEKGENDKKPRAIVSTENKKSEDKKGGASKKDSKRSASFREERAPKKARTEKLCDLCKKYGGAHTTHNTVDCKKFDAGGSLKSGFLPRKKSDRNENFAQIMKEGFAQVTKAFKKDIKKASRKEKKRKHESDSDDS